jgi:phospholipase/carboxylesterase
MHKTQVVQSGKSLSEASRALILLHGRGSNAMDILGLAQYMKVKEFTLLAPEATGNTWYPYSFMAPRESNEPWLTSAMEMMDETVEMVLEAGIPAGSLYIAGFSQGACLSLEYAARHPRPYGGIIALTGGLIGQSLDPASYTGSLSGVPVWMSSGDEDPHVPLARIRESGKILKKMGARITEEIFPGRPHTVIEPEMDGVNKLFFNKLK